MDGKMILAALACLGVPMALFVGALELAAEPVVVHEVIIDRAGAPAADAHALTPGQLRALPDALRDALDAAAREGASQHLRVDASTRLLLLRMAAAPEDATSVLVRIGAAVLALELHSWVEEGRAAALAHETQGWLGEARDAAAAWLAGAVERAPR